MHSTHPRLSAHRSIPTHRLRTPLGALPARFRRPRLLIVGCGDVGQRVLQQLEGRCRLWVLTSSLDKQQHFRAMGIRSLVANLDDARSLRRLAAGGEWVMHLAPPPPQGLQDSRTRHLLQALQRARKPKKLVYVSSSGVYGDCAGALVHETRKPQPTTARAQRRWHAEQQIRAWGLPATRRHTGEQRSATQVCVLRSPGIYAADRQGGTPRERLLKGLPVLVASEDVYTNHIHADDLARACIWALYRGKAQRLYNICDDTVMKMGDYLDEAADFYALPRPPRVSRAQAQERLSAMSWSFMTESRRLSNARMKAELMQLRHPRVKLD